MKISMRNILAATLATSLIGGTISDHSAFISSKTVEVPQVEYFALVPEDISSNWEPSGHEEEQFESVKDSVDEIGQTEESSVQRIWIENSEQNTEETTGQTDVIKEVPAAGTGEEIINPTEISNLLLLSEELSKRVDALQNQIEADNSVSYNNESEFTSDINKLVEDQNNLYAQVESMKIRLEELQAKEAELNQQILLTASQTSTIEQIKNPVAESETVSAALGDSATENLPAEEAVLETPNPEETSMDLDETAVSNEVSSNQEQLNFDITAQIEANQNEQKELESQIESANEQAAALEQKISDLKIQAATGSEQTELATETKSVNMPGQTPNYHILKGQVAELENQIAELANSDTPDEKVLSQLKTDLNCIEATLKDMETALVYRVYNPNSGEHFYTEDVDERNYLVSVGWRDEGIGWQAPKNNKEVPVYRLYNPNAGDHHYTIHADERDHLVSVGWRYENIGWYSDSWKGVEILRVYNPNAKMAGAHHFTTSEIERDHLTSVGWKNEQIGFYGRFVYSICQEVINGKEGIVYYDQNDKKLAGSQKINGYWYYFEPETGFQATGYTNIPGTEDYRYFQNNGKHARGEKNIDGNFYYFDEESGLALKNTFYQAANNITRYFGMDGKAVRASFEKDSITFTVNDAAEVLKAYINDPVLYSQRDKQWANRYVGYYRFGPTGCVPTTLSEIVSRLCHTTLLPVDLGINLASKNLFNKEYMGAGNSAVFETARMYNLKVIPLPNAEAAAAFLKTGGLIATAVGYSQFVHNGDHELLIYGYDNGKVYVHDSYDADKSGQYTLSYLYSIKSKNEYLISNGGPFFGFCNPAFNYFG